MLVGTLLLAIITVSGFTIVLLQGQRAILEETVRKSETVAVMLLANRVEQAVLNVIRPPFRTLKNIPVDDSHWSQRLGWMQQRFPEVEWFLFLDARLQRLENYPPTEIGEETAALYEWLTERLRMEHSKSDVLPDRLRSFSEIVAGHPTLFVWQPRDDAENQPGWLLIAFNLERMQRERIAPLLADFRQSHAGTIELKNGDSEWVEGTLSWPVGRLLPSWELVFEADPQITRERLRQARLVIFGVASAVLLAMVLATFAVWREIRRERALLELRNRFVANVSHELRSPLALIRMYTETLYLGRLTDEGRRQHYYQTILRESERLTRMIDNVLDFARVSKGIPIYRLTETDLRRTVSQVIEDYRPQVRQSGLRLEAQLQRNLPPVPHAPHGVTQMLLNLIDNAIKYGASGQIVVVTLKQSDHWVQLKVTDRGQGVAVKKRQGRYQTNEGHRKGEGIGLGLVLVEQIAAAHHATFCLQSAADAPGTEAIISFPAENISG